MKQILRILERHALWLLLLAGMDCFWAVILWVSDIRAFRTLTVLIVLSSLLLYAAVIFVLYRKETRRRILFQSYITDPNVCNEEKLLNALSRDEGDSIRLLTTVLSEYQTTIRAMDENLRDYEEYVESWVHEAKTPLSLLTLLLDNRSDEIPQPIRIKLDYILSQLQEDVTQMLYYARLKSSTKDYRFETVSLNECIEEVIEDYGPLLEEKHFMIQNQVQEETVYTDRRGLLFMLGQIVSNAVKYSRQTPTLTFSVRHTEKADILSIADNGTGVKPYDLPYIFQKSFTGDSKDSQKKATGMGLYLTKKMADDLNLHLEAVSEWHQGFELLIYFPV